MRSQLPSLEGVAFLNAGTCGPMPQAALAAMRDEAEFQAQKPRTGRAVFEHVLEGRERARAAAARSVGAAAGDVALTNSTSQGVATIVAAIDWRPGDRVITTTEEHPGITLPLAAAAARHGVDVREVAPAEVIRAIDEGTRLVAISHVLWTTGTELDLPAISRAAHAVNAQVLVDGAQSVGNILVDVPASGVDYYAFSGQKWLLGPMGSGGLWVRPELASEIVPPMPTFLSVEHDETHAYLPGAPRLDAGMIDPATLAGFTAAVEWVEAMPGGRAQWTATAAAKVAAARDRLSRVSGLEVAPGDSGLLAITGELIHDPEAQATELVEAGVLVRSIPGTNYLRASVGAWTVLDDIEALIAGLGGS
jgi:L-cysteine/cystine lyase